MSTNLLSSYDLGIVRLTLCILRSWWSFVRRKAGWISCPTWGESIFCSLLFSSWKIEWKWLEETLSLSLHVFELSSAKPPSCLGSFIILQVYGKSPSLMGPSLQASTLQAASPSWWIVSWILRCVVPRRSRWRRPKGTWRLWSLCKGARNEVKGTEPLNMHEHVGF